MDKKAREGGYLIGWPNVVSTCRVQAATSRTRLRLKPYMSELYSLSLLDIVEYNDSIRTALNKNSGSL